MNNIPNDLLDIIEQIIIYEDRVVEEDSDFQYEYAYIEDCVDDNCKEKEEETIIKISL